ncbi:hypothetical protein KBTX_03428 [wastewater metagenome]|uniref:CRISPR type III-B/RAMP module-associated protein Cmr5 n=2 Tax=unclassified sequences TaxID=12908 RepID=A0A5B8RGC3_9ZZZZ|nr:type III-B CRISPR module-associated protein Cmr5 [Arhodomonas sp. KWT]QEA07083.1 hypothetical protein KBTEX_03428 [uncultured organism]
MTMTLEQRRAADAWTISQSCSPEFVNLAKAMPALIMNSGLMQTAAFVSDKALKAETSGVRRMDNHHLTLGIALRRWLAGQFPERFGRQAGEPADPGYGPFMDALMNAEPREFQAITAEAMAWLRWVRQIAPTRQQGEG